LALTSSVLYHTNVPVKTRVIKNTYNFGRNRHLGRATLMNTSYISIMGFNLFILKDFQRNVGKTRNEEIGDGKREMKKWFTWK